MPSINLSEPRFTAGTGPSRAAPCVMLLVAVHGRHDVAKRMLRHSLGLGQRLAPVCWFRPLVIMSSQDVAEMGSFCDERGILWMETANLPLSNKWQRGVTLLSQSHRCLDALMLAGSDDFLSYEYVNWVIRLVASGQTYACGPDWVYLYNAKTGQMARYEGPTLVPDGSVAPVGAGRVFSHALLCRTGWRLWPVEANSSLDGMCTLWLSNLGYSFNVLRIDAKPGASVVDIKDGNNIHNWERFTKDALIYSPENADGLLKQWGLYEAVKGDAT